MTISFEEAAFGTIKEINISRKEVCDVCHGNGAKPGTNVKTCDRCNGRGKVHVTQNTIMGTISTVKTCDKCGGEGKVVESPCPKCNKKGHITKTKKINITVPAGIDNGQAIPLRGEGDAGLKGGPNGDIYVVVKVGSHKYFRREGYDIFANVRVPFAKMALGGDIRIPTLEGEMEFSIPEGTSSGTKFRVKDQGIPILNGKGRGVLEFVVDVDVPKKLNDEQRELLKKFAQSFGDEVNVKKKSIFDDIKSKFN
jgi:molecular chaperone DnaJ